LTVIEKLKKIENISENHLHSRNHVFGIMHTVQKCWWPKKESRKRLTVGVWKKISWPKTAKMG